MASNPLIFNPRRKIPEISIIDVNKYRYGVVSILNARSIARGAAADSKNWVTRDGKIELRRGMAYLGSASVNIGNGKTSGIKKVTNALGVELLLGTYGKKLKYFDNTAQEWVENGTDLLGAAVVDASGMSAEDIFISEYTSPAGNQAFVNSPNCAGYFKLMVANPGSAIDQYDSSKNFKGYIRVDTSRTLLWGRTSYPTGIHGSYIDNQAYTTVTSESVGTGDGSTTVFTKTLAGITGKRTIFGLIVTAGSVTFTDNYAGTLTGSDGSTGSINYVTGLLSLTFVSAPAPALAITCTYQWEDSTTHGICDFTKSATRLAGQGFVFPQDEGGGPAQNVQVYATVYYCFHLKKTWALTIGTDDTTATNLPYRQNVGIPNQRAAVETGDGIYYIDDINPDDIKVRILTFQTGGSQQVIPVPISNNLRLSHYRFDQAAAINWGDTVLFACRQVGSTINDRVLSYNRLWKSWDILDYNVNCFEIFNGTLVCGDSISNNFFTLFSGFDDIENYIDNYWIGNQDKMGIDGLKKDRKIYLEGEIAADQSLDIYLSLDSGSFFKVGTIDGSGAYVDKNRPVDIGAGTLGTHDIGGDPTLPGVSAFHYEVLLNVNTDKFEYAQIKYVATKIGYVSVTNQKWWDVRYKGRKVPLKYRT